MQKLIYGSLLALILPASFLFPNISAIATTHYNILAVEYSEGCQKMLDNNMNTTCPTLDKIWKYDKTNKNISGNLFKYHGKYIRTNPQVRNHFMFYNNMTVCVDCSMNNIDGPDLIKTIFLEPSNFGYINKTEVVTNNHYSTLSDRYVSPDCITSTIGYSDFMLNDTIKYMLSNCTTTSYNATKTNTIKDVLPDYKDAMSYKNQKWFVQALQATKTTNCLIHKCHTPKDPYSKW